METNQVNSVDETRHALAKIRNEISKSVVGQDSAVSGLVIGLLVDGHILLEGVPGVAKTLLVRTLAHTLNLDFKRIQFTPDLMPSDVTGSVIYDESAKDFVVKQGPIFANLVLADEINRTPAKTQAALLEAMQEHQVSINGETMILPDPFMVIATQNPIEYEGTYSLPEAQLDRFTMKINMKLPSHSDEVEILSKHAQGFDAKDLTKSGVVPVADANIIKQARYEMNTVKVSVELLSYIVDLVQATRKHPAVMVGVSPRGATALMKCSKAWAWLNGRNYVTPDDIKTMSKPTLSHRIRLLPEAELEGMSSDKVITSLLQNVTVPR